MQYILIAIVLMALCVLGFTCRKSTANGAVNSSTNPVTVSSGKYLSQQDIQKQLAVIAQKPPPKELAIGAMCYDIAGPPPRIDYVCPVCGEKTIYALEDTADEKTRLSRFQTVWTIQDLENCRRFAQTIKKLDITLDESQFCKKCSPGIDTPTLDLIVRYPDRPVPHRVSGVNWTDLAMLKAAADGKLKYKDRQDTEVALKGNLPRLQELLGVDTQAKSGEHLSKQKIHLLLAGIAKTPPPKELAIGAMCYEVAVPPNRIDYVCPACGEKTIYALGNPADEKTRISRWQMVRNLQDLENCRRLARTIQKLDISLDESQFCKKCTPGIEAPALGLIVRYPDQSRPHRVSGVNWTDLAMLKAASDGKLIYKDRMDFEKPLKKSLPRLEELLGVALDSTNTERNN